MRGNGRGRGRNGGGGGGGGWKKGGGGGGGGRNQRHHDTPLNQLPAEAFFRPSMLANPWEQLETAHGLPHVFEAVPRQQHQQQARQEVPMRQEIVRQEHAMAVQMPSLGGGVALELIVKKMAISFGLEQEEEEMLDPSRHSVEERLAWCCDRAAAMYAAALAQYSVQGGGL